MTSPRDLVDITRVCRDCAVPFVITVGEQRSFDEIRARAGWGSVHLPTRCGPCRRIRRAEKHAAEHTGGGHGRRA